MKKVDLKTLAQFMAAVVIGFVLGAIIIYAIAHSF